MCFLLKAKVTLCFLSRNKTINKNSFMPSIIQTESNISYTLSYIKDPLKKEDVIKGKKKIF